MTRLSCFLAACLLLGAGAARAAGPQPAALAGAWCFYQQTGEGQTVPERVDLLFHPDGKYEWREGPFEQKGSWTLDKDLLTMSNIGRHTIVTLGDDRMELRRMTLMSFKKGGCGPGFGNQDVIRYHNAASMGDMAVIDEYLGKGIDVDIADFFRHDSALIKAAKFCQVRAAHRLLDKGAKRQFKNEEGKTALDYARASDFHKGCPALVKALE